MNFNNFTTTKYYNQIIFQCNANKIYTLKNIKKHTNLFEKEILTYKKYGNKMIFLFFLSRRN